jgi:hypothetical protein
MAKAKIKVEKTCCFEWYNKETKSIFICGKPAEFIYQGKYYLCAECCKGVATTGLHRVAK